MKSNKILLAVLGCSLLGLASCGELPNNSNQESNQISNDQNSNTDNDSSDNTSTNSQEENNSQESAFEEENNSQESASEEENNSQESASEESESELPNVGGYDADDLELMKQYFGNKYVPYLNCTSYSVQDDSENDVIDFYVMFNGVSSSDYNNYITSLKKVYTFLDEGYDYYGDYCYYYEYGNFYVDVWEESNTITVNMYDKSLVDGSYTEAFTSEDNTTIQNAIGTTLPFLPCYTYTVSSDSSSLVITFSNFTVADFNSYLASVKKVFTYTGTSNESDGSTAYNFTYNDKDVSLYYYPEDDEYYAYVYLDIAIGNGGNNGGNEDAEIVYTSYSNEDLATLASYFDFIVPFLPCTDYVIEDDSKKVPDVYVLFQGYTSDNLESFLTACDNLYSFDEEGYNDDGDYCYFYSNGDYYIDIALYDDIVQVNIYDQSLAEGENQGGSSNPDDLMTNAGAGLPTGIEGIYNVNFAADNVIVKNVTELGDYEGGCPTTGSPAVLVVPVQFSDYTAADLGYTIENIKNAFLPYSETNATLQHDSVYDYFYKSSYGKLTLDIDVLDQWFTPANESSYYKNKTVSAFGYEFDDGEQYVMNEVLAYLDAQGYDLSKYDSDNNGIIDSIVLINTLPIDDSGDSTFNWAFRYYNILQNSATNDYYYYDGVCANDYLWASYQFLKEDANGFNGKNPTNTYTFIHEFSHVLGSDDYYDTAYVSHPLEGYDVMDSGFADHNAYTKFYYGWLTSSRLIVADDQVTVNLDAFEKNGDSIIIANNFDETLGLFQEYYIVVYYNNTGLNADGGLFEDAGIVVYHINASLMLDTQYGDNYYYIYNTNTNASDEDYGTDDNLIEFVKNGSDFVYLAGDSLSAKTTNDQGEVIAYTFTVDSISSDSATLTFTKNN